MLLNGKSLTGYKVHAQDGDAGKLLYFFFDDSQWKVRYLVLRGSKLGNIKALITPDSVVAHDWADQRFDLRLTKETIRTSPEIDITQAVTCQGQDAVDRHYGCSYQRQGETNAHSNNDIAGFSVNLEDGKGGQVEDIIVDENDWSIPYLILDTRSWLPGKKVLIPVGMTDSLSWEEGTMDVRMSRDAIRNAPSYDPSYPISKDYERQLHAFYGTYGRARTGDMHELIRRKAQELCNRRGCTPGNELNDWLEAERIVKSETRR